MSDYPFGDHSMFGAHVRAAMLHDVLALTAQAFPVRTFPVSAPAAKSTA